MHSNQMNFFLNLTASVNACLRTDVLRDLQQGVRRLKQIVLSEADGNDR